MRGDLPIPHAPDSPDNEPVVHHAIREPEANDIRPGKHEKQKGRWCDRGIDREGDEMPPPASPQIVLPDFCHGPGRPRGRMMKIDPTRGTEPDKHRLIRTGQPVQPVPAAACLQRHAGIGLVKRCSEPIPALGEPAPDSWPGRIFLAGIVDFRHIRVKEVPFVIGEQQVNFQCRARFPWTVLVSPLSFYSTPQADSSQRAGGEDAKRPACALASNCRHAITGWIGFP